MIEYINLKVNYYGLSTPLYPYFIGAFIRGNFGLYLKRISCPFRGKKNCYNCIIKDGCFYFNVFEKDRNGKEQIPHPFIIETDYFFEKKLYDISFNVIVFGEIVKNYEYFILVFYELWKNGFGRRKIRAKKFEILSRGKLIFSSGKGEKILERPVKKEFSLKDRGEKGVRRVFIKLKSPLRLMRKGKALRRVLFEDLIRASLRRYILISKNYGEGGEVFKPERIKFTVGEAKNVETLKDETLWVEYSRYSTRRREKLRFRGLKGEIEYEGKFLEEHTALLRFAEIFHIGSLTSFGYGKIALEFNH